MLRSALLILFVFLAACCALYYSLALFVYAVMLYFTLRSMCSCTITDYLLCSSSLAFAIVQLCMYPVCVLLWAVCVLAWTLSAPAKFHLFAVRCAMFFVCCPLWNLLCYYLFPFCCCLYCMLGNALHGALLLLLYYLLCFEWCARSSMLCLFAVLCTTVMYAMHVLCTAALSHVFTWTTHIPRPYYAWDHFYFFMIQIQYSCKPRICTSCELIFFLIQIWFLRKYFVFGRE
jgi:hypothetical protein